MVSSKSPSPSAWTPMCWPGSGRAAPSTKPPSTKRSGNTSPPIDRGDGPQLRGHKKLRGQFLNREWRSSKQQHSQFKTQPHLAHVPSLTLLDQLSTTKISVQETVINRFLMPVSLKHSLGTHAIHVFGANLRNGSRSATLQIHRQRISGMSLALKQNIQSQFPLISLWAIQRNRKDRYSGFLDIPTSLHQ